MAVVDAIDINSQQKKIITDFLSYYLPNTTVWAYGSRVKWNSRPESDLDITVFSTPEQSRAVFELRDAFEESDLVFSVDVLVWDQIPDSFKKNIKKDYFVLTQEVEKKTLGFEQFQKIIVPILSALDDKIELNQKMNQTLEEIARAIFKSWFVNFDPVRTKAEGRSTGLSTKISDLFPNELVESEIGEIPKGWEIHSLDQMGTFENGLTWQKYSEQESQWFVASWVNQHMPKFRSIAENKATTIRRIERELLEQALCVVPSEMLIEKYHQAIHPLIDRGILAQQESKTLTALRDTLLPPGTSHD